MDLAPWLLGMWIVEHGLLRMQDVGGDVLDAAFSPDGSALATASGDGCLFFLDDHSSHQPDVQYWKYGCSLNTELKVWSCESWSCLLQTISFNRLGEDMGFRLMVDLDPTARYLVLVDINKCLVF